MGLIGIDYSSPASKQLAIGSYMVEESATSASKQPQMNRHVPETDGVACESGRRPSTLSVSRSTGAVALLEVTLLVGIGGPLHVRTTVIEERTDMYRAATRHQRRSRCSRAVTRPRAPRPTSCLRAGCRDSGSGGRSVQLRWWKSRYSWALAVSLAFDDSQGVARRS